MFLLRYLKKNLLLLISLTGIITFLSCGISYVKIFSEEIKENEYYFDEFNCSLIFSEENEKGLNFYENLIELISKEKDINLVNDTMRSHLGRAHGIYLNSNLDVTPKIKEGRFFDKSDFKDNNKKLAVVGVLQKDNIKVIDNKKTININGNDYEVIGIMGDESLSKEANYEIIFNLNSLIKTKGTEIQKSGWTVSSKKDIRSTLDNLKTSMKDFQFIYSKSQKSSNPILSVFKRHGNSIYYMITIFMSIFINIFIVIYLWFDGLIKEIGVRKCFGANNHRIYLYILKKCLLNNSIATVIATSILICLEKFKIIGAEYYFHVTNLIFIAISICIVSGMILSILVKKINSIKPNFILRGIK